MHVQHVFMHVVSFCCTPGREPGYENHLRAQLKFRFVRFPENGEAAITRAASRMAKSRQLCTSWPGLELQRCQLAVSDMVEIDVRGKNSR